MQRAISQERDVLILLFQPVLRGTSWSFSYGIKGKENGLQMYLPSKAPLCVWMCVYANGYGRVHVDMCVDPSTCVHVHGYKCVQEYTCVWRCLCVCMCMCVHECTSVYTYVCVPVRMHAYMYVYLCMFACMCEVGS